METEFERDFENQCRYVESPSLKRDLYMFLYDRWLDRITANYLTVFEKISLPSIMVNIVDRYQRPFS